MSSSGADLTSFSIAVIVISSVSVILRAWSRLVTPVSSFGVDDCTAYIAWALSVGLCVLVVKAQGWGLDSPVSELSLSEFSRLYKVIFAGQILFSLSVSFSKYSAVAFIDRVFAVRCNASLLWRISYFLVAGIVVISGFIFVMLDIFWCNPVRKFWDPLSPGSCMPTGPLLVPGAVVDVVIDVMVLTLPLPPILKLQATPWKKTLIFGLFLLGYSVVAISVGRLVAIVKQSYASGEASLDFVPSLYWAVAESGLSILVISIPAIFQLIKRATMFGVSALFDRTEHVTPSQSQINFAQTSRQIVTGNLAGSRGYLSANGSTGPEHGGTGPWRPVSSESRLSPAGDPYPLDDLDDDDQERMSKFKARGMAVKHQATVSKANDV